jgi:hypothetical protein
MLPYSVFACLLLRLPPCSPTPFSLAFLYIFYTFEHLKRRCNKMNICKM